MFETGTMSPGTALFPKSIQPSIIHNNLPAEDLVEQILQKKQGKLSDRGAICINTGRFTGRSPKDRYIVKDHVTRHTVDWGNINQPISEIYFNQLEKDITNYFSTKEMYLHDGYVCADENYRLNIRLFAEKPWSALFANNMFMRLTALEKKTFSPDWSILCAPDFKADPTVDGVRSENFAIINFSKKRILIGGTGYTGEIKKGIFSVLNYTLPIERDVLSMHCSANVDKDGDVAVFFGLSGTGKTTLSADAERYLIGDDEHGWSEDGIFNFEGGCYAKCIDLSEEKEPEIYHAIKSGAILENICFKEDEITPDYTKSDITQNTRVSYPIHHIQNALAPSKSGHPTNIFFLTADAFGVLPPVSKLTPGQAMYHFVSGYTAKVAGTEEGVNEPTATFSACFGAPFMPLNPTKYAAMLGKKMRAHEVNVWLINTGWTGGPFGVGKRINLKYTRAMIKTILAGELNDVEYRTHEIFGLEMPKSCANVPSVLLNPKDTWASGEAYDIKANYLAAAFNKNFEKFVGEASDEVKKAAPKESSVDS